MTETGNIICSYCCQFIEIKIMFCNCYIINKIESPFNKGMVLTIKDLLVLNKMMTLNKYYLKYTSC